MGGEFRIRGYLTTDAEALTRIAAAAGLSSRKDFFRKVRATSLRVDVLVQDDAPVGYIVTKLQTGKILIDEIAVASKFRRFDAWKFLLDSVEARLDESRYEMTITVNERVPLSILTFFKSYGFFCLGAEGVSEEEPPSQLLLFSYAISRPKAAARSEAKRKKA
jgi:hypothetical protein